jgi:uncharacterized NAD(P)/FAD-binding protein YdhS
VSEWNAQAVRRVIRAHGVKVATTGVEHDLEELAALRDDLDSAIRTAVAGLRARDVSWAGIGDALGVTRSAAYQRFGGDNK